MRRQPRRTGCKAGTAELGGIATNSIASRYLNLAKQKYSTKEFELPSVVGATEHYRNYIYGRFFTIISGHKALLTSLNLSPKGINIFQQVNLMVRYIINLGLENRAQPRFKNGDGSLFSTYPSTDAPPTSHYDSTFTVAKNNMINQSLNPPRTIDKEKKHRWEERFPTDTCHNRTAEVVKTCTYV